MQPQFIPNLVTSIDFFDIKIKDTITSLSSNTIINDCALTGDAALCGLIHRGPTGSLWFNTRNYVHGDQPEHRQGLDARHGRRVALPLDIGQFGRLSLNSERHVHQGLPDTAVARTGLL